MGSLGPHDGHMLKVFGAHIKQGFGYTPYHVGSSLTEKTRYRDVDVRLILPDDEFIVYFGDWTKAGWEGPKLYMWQFAWSMFGKYLTRLPIDFQIQAQTDANESYSGPRSALLLTADDLAFVGDSR